ncbi:MAG TPA: ABC transporter ATP-binding protein [Microthrixaceae bacterium]|nr:ABC transporter ATP-binding protein [Microthrixaceae bacterium]
MGGSGGAETSTAEALLADVSLSLGQLALDVQLEVAAGEVLAVLGPNGAGKTTLLRALAGLQEVERGRIILDGVVLFDSGAADSSGGGGSTSVVSVLAEHRPVGMVFQDYLLFPHLSAAENVAFGPRARGVPKRAADATAREWLERVGLAEYADSRPSELSGGQAQRVALARALANEPRMLLLDESLSALDASTRALTRRDLRGHLADFDGVTVLVTHDPLDALALADKVLILEAGRVTQVGSITDVTSRPRTPYVAELLGVNLLRGVASGHVVAIHGAAGGSAGTVDVFAADASEGDVFVVLRPSAITLHRALPDSSARNVWDLRIVGFDLLGDRVKVRLSGVLELVAEVTPEAISEMSLVEGDLVWATAKATELTVFPA